MNKIISGPIKNLRHFVRDPLNFMSEMHEKHGDFFSLYIGPKKFHFVSHPQFAEYILNSKSEYFQKSRLIFNKIKPITGKNGLVQLEGEQWKEMRRVTSEVFYKRYLDSYIHVINAYTDQLVVQLREKSQAHKSIDIAAFLIRYTINIALRIFFGKSHDAISENIANQFITLNFLCGLRMRQVISFPLIIPTKLNIKIYRARAALEKNIDRLIDNKHDAKGLSLLAHLIDKLKYREQCKKLIKDQMMTFLFASYETTASSLAFSCYLLAKHPAEQQKIRDESQSGQSVHTLLAYREALRLYPPAYMLAREVIHRNTLAGTRLIPKDNVIVSVAEIHRHKNFWLNSSDFIPERFVKNDNAESHKFAFIPFGYGKRVCSGMQLAMIEAAIVLKKLTQHFQFSLAPNAHLQVEAMVTMHPKGKLDLRIEAL